MKKHFLLPLIAVLSYGSYAQCNVDDITETILVNGVAGQSVCYGTQVATKLTNLEDGITYTITYPGFTQSKQYWSDGNFTSITWSLGTLTQSVTYTITGKADGCSQSETLISNTINVILTSPSVTLTPSTDPSQVCSNSTITLTASGTPGLTYTWHADRQIDIQSFNQGHYHGATFSPDQPAAYWVVASESQCGTSAESEHISVNFISVVTTPLISSINGPHCKGAGTSTYTAIASNATEYTWAITGGGSSTISTGGTISWDPNFAGNAQVTVTANGCGGSTASNQVSVIANTIATATLSGGGATCSGVPIPMTLNADSGNLDDVWYSLFLDGNFVSQQEGWSNRNQTDNPISSISWNKSNAGRYTVTATGNGCTNIPMGGEAYINIIQPSVITLTPSSDPDKVCDGEIFSLTASGGTDFTWHANKSLPDFNGFDQGNVHGTTFNPYLSAIYWVTGTESNCRTSATSNNVGITINPLPDATISPVGTLKICSTCIQPINADSQEGNKYQWRKNGANILGSTSSSFAASESGDYSVLIISGAGCSNHSSNLQLSLNVPPVVSTSNQSLMLPTNSTTLTANASDPDGTIVSYLWTQISGGGLTTSGELTNSIALSELHAGSYQFQISVRDDFGEMKNSSVTVQVNAPLNNYNYIRESSILVSEKTQPNDIVGLPIEKKNVTTTYFDGLGRPMQTVAAQTSPNNKTDIVTPVTYDEFGRENKKFLPYVAMNTDGSFKQTGFTDQTSFYNSPPTKIINDPRSFSETIYEPSPLNRPQQDYGPGQNWKKGKKYVGHSYETNAKNDVLLFTYDPSTGFVSTGSDSQAQWFERGQLQAKRTTDEHGNDVIQYVDKFGHTICKKVLFKIDGLGNKLYASTYYIYDDLGNLVVVLPPEAIVNSLDALTSQN